ncbi:MAG: hypothetical protein AB8B48_12705 [Pseudomonadales bacterium]
MNSAFSKNPIDTASQREYELLALDIFKHPEFQRAKSEVAKFWLDEVQASEDARSCFEAAFEEVCFGATIWSLNQDPMHPSVVTISRVAHSIDGVRIPGSRWGIDNPDSVYRVIPISGALHYRITGRVAPHRLTENYFTLWDQHMATVDVLSGKDLQLDDQDRFVISVDSEPANGRVNHIQSSPAAHQFYIRDVLQNWGDECVNELSIELLDGDGVAQVRNFDEDLQRAIKYMWDYARNTTRWNRQATDKPVNAFDFKIDRDVDGALRNQIYIMGQFKLDAGQAMLINVDLGGAEYFIAPITNLWGTSNEIITKNGSLNLHQSIANADGSYTFVVSVEDPGIHNWLNPDGMSEGILTLRWAEFPSGRPEDSLQASAQIVDLTDLERHMPASVPTVSATERLSQHADRAASYAWRILENA